MNTDHYSVSTTCGLDLGSALTYITYRSMQRKKLTNIRNVIFQFIRLTDTFFAQRLNLSVCLGSLNLMDLAACKDVVLVHSHGDILIRGCLSYYNSRQCSVSWLHTWKSYCCCHVAGIILLFILSLLCFDSLLCFETKLTGFLETLRKVIKVPA